MTIEKECAISVYFLLLFSEIIEMFELFQKVKQKKKIKILMLTGK